VAATVAQYYRRARPTIVVDEISRSPDTIPHQSSAVPNLDLAAACEENDFVAGPMAEAREKRISEEQYVVCVHNALDQAETAMDGLPALHSAAEKLSDCLQREDFADFEATFSRELVRFWPSLTGAQRKGEFNFQGTPPDPLAQMPIAPPVDKDNNPIPLIPGLLEYPDVQAEVSADAEAFVLTHFSWKKQIVQDKNGELLIPLGGTRNLAFPWRFLNTSQQPKAQVFAMRTAVSFASCYKPDLQQFTNFLLKVEQHDRPELELLRTRLEAELHAYERIVVKGNIANRGGSPVTVTTAGRLFIGLAGYSFTDQTRNLKSHPTDEEVEMVVGADRPGVDPSFESSITIDPESVTRFVATSATRIKDLRYGEVLLSLMTSGERECYLGTMIVSPHKRMLGRRRQQSQFTPFYTYPQAFRDSTAEVQVPPRPRGGFKGFFSQGKETRAIERS
jgi:hypothetical protein